MNFLLTSAATLCPVFMAASFFLYFALKRARHFEVKHATLAAQTASLQRDAEEVRDLREQNSQYLEHKSIAETQLQEAEKKLHVALAERNEFMAQKEAALRERAETEQRVALMQQHVTDAEKRMQDWEVQKAENLKATTASVMEVGGKLSSKLLEDHKREAEAAKKEAEEAAKKNAQSLIEQMTSITQTVSALREQTGQTSEKMSTVWRALTTPAGAGQLAEIGLENTLKNLGLEAGRDYVMQYVVGGGSALRPDAVIFLPQDMVMVIDSKASKFLLEIAEAEEKGIDAEELFKGFAQTMNKHLNDLRTKDYEAAIRAAFEGSGRSGAISATHIIMCVPSEAAIGHLKQADAQLLQKAEKLGVIIASPASLFGLLSLARHNLGLVRQSENHDRIITNVRQLMDNIITMLSHAEKVGKGLESASKQYSNFSASVNRNILSKMRQLTGFGIVPAKSKALPDRLSTFEVRSGEEPLTIEGEVEAVEDTNAIEDFSKQKISA